MLIIGLGDMLCVAMMRGDDLCVVPPVQASEVSRFFVEEHVCRAFTQRFWTAAKCES